MTTTNKRIKETIMRGIAPTTTSENTPPVSTQDTKKATFAQLRAARRKLDAEAAKFLSEAPTKLDELIEIANNTYPRQS